MATDTFDGTGSLAGSWTKISGTGTITQSGGEAVPSAKTDSIGYSYSGAATGTPQRSKITIVDALGIEGGAQTYWSVETNRSGSNKYQFTVTGNHWYLAKNAADVDDGAGSYNNAGSVPMDVELTVEVSGANRVLKGYIGGALIVTYTDTSSVLSNGAVGMSVYTDGAAAYASITAWEGGDLSGGSSPVGYLTLPPLAPPRR